MLLLAVGGVQLAGSVLRYRATGAALPRAQLVCDAAYLTLAALRLVTQLPQYPAAPEPGAADLTPPAAEPAAPSRRLGAAEDGAGWLSVICFWWAQPLMRRGRQRRLHAVADLHELPAALSTDCVDARFTACLRRRAAHLRQTAAADPEPERLLPPAAEQQTSQVPCRRAREYGVSRNNEYFDTDRRGKSRELEA